MMAKKYPFLFMCLLVVSHGMHGAALDPEPEVEVELNAEFKKELAIKYLQSKQKRQEDEKARGKVTQAQKEAEHKKEVDELTKAIHDMTTTTESVEACRNIKAMMAILRELERLDKELEKEDRIKRGYIAMGMEPTPAELEQISKQSASRQATFAQGVLADAESMGAGEAASPSAPGIGLVPPPAPVASRPHDEHEQKRLAEWESEIEELDKSTIEGVLAENMPSGRSSHIQRLIKQWEKTPGEDEYDFKTDAEAAAACLRLPRQLILEGVPGTGKSVLARAIAKKCNMKIFFKAASLIPDSYVHSGDTDLKNVFAHANASRKKCAIIIDEIDSIFSHHNRAEQSDHDADMTRTLWTLLDKYEKKPILFIGTTNDISRVPSPIRSRFEGDHTLHISPMASKERLEKLIHDYMKLLGDIENSPVVKDIAPKTLGFSQRRVKKLVEMSLSRYFDLTKEEQRDRDKALKKCFAEAFESLKVTDRLYDPEKPFGDRVCDFTAKYGPTVAMAINVGNLGVSGYSAYRSEQNRQVDLKHRADDIERQNKMREEDKTIQQKKDSPVEQVKSAAIQGATTFVVQKGIELAAKAAIKIIFPPAPVPLP